MLVKAEREPDDEARGVYEADAPRCQHAWRCPNGGFAPADSAAELGPAPRRVLEQVERLIGAPLPPVCPLYLTRLQWVHNVAEAHEYREHGELRVVAPQPSQVLVDALREFGAGCADRLRDDMRRAQKPKETSDG